MDVENKEISLVSVAAFDFISIGMTALTIAVGVPVDYSAVVAVALGFLLGCSMTWNAAYIVQEAEKWRKKRTPCISVARHSKVGRIHKNHESIIPYSSGKINR